MATAGDIADRALKRILVEASESPLEADDYADFFGSMNALMAAWEAEGLRMGYTPVDNVSDVMTVPDACLRGITANMAIEVASDYGATVSQSLAREANNGLKAIRRVCVRIGSASRPSTLPVGGGNSGITYREPRYYGRSPTAYITLAQNTLETETGAAFTYVKAQAFWQAQRSEAIQADPDGRLTSLMKSTATVRVRVNVNVKADASLTGGVAIYKNGETPSLTQSAALSTTAVAVSLDGDIELDPGDYLELFVTDLTGTNKVTVVSGDIEIGEVSSTW